MTSDFDSEFDLRDFAAVLRRRAALIAGVGATVFVLTFVLSGLRANIYLAVAEVRVVDSNNSGALFGVTPRTNTDRDIANQIHLLKSRSVRRLVNDQMGNNAQRVGRVSIAAIAGTDVASIRVESRSPAIAAEAANAFAEVYVNLRRSQLSGDLDTQAEQLRSTATAIGAQIVEIDSRLAVGPSQAEADVLRAQRSGLVQQQSDFRQRATEFEVEADLRSTAVDVVEEAREPTSPFSPTPLRDAILATGLVVLLMVGVAFVLEWLDNRVNTATQVEALTGVPVIGSIPMHGTHHWLRRRKLATRRMLVLRRSPAAEAYRTLQTSIRFSSLGKKKQRIVITSSSGGEGKTTVTSNLAAVMAESGLRVVVVSADLRRPMIGTVFGLDESTQGLTTTLVGDTSVADALVSVTSASGSSLYVLPSGPLPGNPAGLLGSAAFGALLSSIEAAGVDLILIDCAPVLPVSDPLVISQHVDGVIVLALAGKTRQSSLAEAIDRLQQVEAPIIGIVLNAVPQSKSYYDRIYGYQAHPLPARSNKDRSEDRAPGDGGPLPAKPGESREVGATLPDS